MLALMTLKSYAMVTFLAAVVLLAGYRWSRSANKRTSARVGPPSLIEAASERP
jgi:hypothetical protein